MKTIICQYQKENFRTLCTEENKLFLAILLRPAFYIDVGNKPTKKIL